MTRQRIQARDISETILSALSAVRGRHGAPRWSSWFDVRDQLSQYPHKVVRVKLASMVRRNIIRGCTCGCRGDFELVDQS